MTQRLSDSATVAGIPVGEVVRPETEAQMGELLADCTARNLSVLVFGGGGSVRTGRTVDGFDIGLDTRALAGVIAYEPADLTLSVRAGTTMAEIASVLAERGQELPVDVPALERTTIGGLIATGFAGPRRLLHGTLKDAMIGCRYVRGDGMVAAAGGMVVKNVSGFEIPRLLHGSWGALAVLTSVNVKVGPRPRVESTVVTGWGDVHEAIAALHGLASGMPSLAASVITVSGGAIATACRVMGRDAAVMAAVGAIEATLPGTHDVLHTDGSRAFWQRHLDDWTPPAGATQIVVGVRPRDVGPAITAIERRAGAQREGFAAAIAPSLGSFRIRDDRDADATSFWPVADLPPGAVAMLESGSDRGADPWGMQRSGQDVMAAIKRQFDPANVLNRGRLFV